MKTSVLTAPAAKPHNRIKAEPAWKLAEFFPKQSQWTDRDYDNLVDSVENGQFIELHNGRLEFRAMPDFLHAMIVHFLRRALEAFVDAHKLGCVFSEGMNLRIDNRNARVPDMMYVSHASLARHTERGCPRAELIIEVVSPGKDNRRNDFVHKRQAYARAGVPEYWIVDPKLERISVLVLSGGKYQLHGKFKKGQKAASSVLKGFEVGVTEALAGTKR